jgi:hypothetical protein
MHGSLVKQLPIAGPFKKEKRKEKKTYNVERKQQRK